MPISLAMTSEGFTSAAQTAGRRLAVIGSLALLLAATGCHKKRSGTDPSSLAPDVNIATTMPAPTATLAADPLAIDLGQTVVLNWRTTNATSVAIDGIGDVAVNGTQTVSPANSTNFHLTAKGEGGSVEANVRVTVRVPQLPAGVGDNSAAGTGSSTGDAGTDAAFHAAVQDVFYDYDSYDLRPDGQTAIGQAASYMASHTGLKLVIGGYCDERGSAEYNLALGENRANTVRTALINAGVAPNRVRIVSYGKEKQFCTEQNESCWQQNRRAQFTPDR